MYTNKENPAVIDNRVILFSINRSYKNGMNDKEVFECVRKAWKLADTKRRRNAEYALATVRGEVKGVFTILRWQINKEEPNRWEFDGETAPTNIYQKYIGNSVKKYRKRGAINPIYVNC